MVSLFTAAQISTDGARETFPKCLHYLAECHGPRSLALQSNLTPGHACFPRGMVFVPTADCLERLHKNNVKVYWTETGNGAQPESGMDVVGENIVVEVAAGVPTFTVTYGGSHVDTYPIAGPAGDPARSGVTPAPATTPQYAWSKNSGHYHTQIADLFKTLRLRTWSAAILLRQTKRCIKTAPSNCLWPESGRPITQPCQAE